MKKVYMVFTLVGAVLGVYTVIHEHRKTLKHKKHKEKIDAEIEEQERNRRIAASKNPYVSTKIGIANEIGDYLKIRENYARPRFSV